jgi:hypothetical protein
MPLVGGALAGIVYKAVFEAPDERDAIVVVVPAP